MTIWPVASTPCTWKTDFAISRPIVEINCIGCSSESWEPQSAPTPWRSRAGWRSRPQHQERSQLDVAGVSVDRGRLDGCDFVLAQAFPDDLKPARKATRTNSSAISKTAFRKRISLG